jgi:hypothetical protein
MSDLVLEVELDRFPEPFEQLVQGAALCEDRGFGAACTPAITVVMDLDVYQNRCRPPRQYL